MDKGRKDVALTGREIGQVDIAGVAGLDARPAGYGDGDRSACNLAIGVGTGFFEEIIGAARVEGGVLIGKNGWSTASYVINIVSIFMIS